MIEASVNKRPRSKMNTAKEEIRVDKAREKERHLSEQQEDAISTQSEYIANLIESAGGIIEIDGSLSIPEAMDEDAIGKLGRTIFESHKVSAFEHNRKAGEYWLGIADGDRINRKRIICNEWGEENYERIAKYFLDRARIVKEWGGKWVKGKTWTWHKEHKPNGSLTRAYQSTSVKCSNFKLTLRDAITNKIVKPTKSEDGRLQLFVIVEGVITAVNVDAAEYAYKNERPPDYMVNPIPDRSDTRVPSRNTKARQKFSDGE